MSATASVKGDLVEIIENRECGYPGDLKAYFKIVFGSAQNVLLPYHNFRHMLHVLWLCYQAAAFYGPKLTGRECRHLFIAALFHDFDHSGLAGNDDLNVERSVRAMKKHLLPFDAGYVGHIEQIIRATEYPHTVPSADLPLVCQIIRDADLAQALSPAWIQHVVFGLAAEWGKKPIEVLGMQAAFHRNLKFHTEWAQTQFPQSAIDEKVSEAEGLHRLLS